MSFWKIWSGRRQPKLPPDNETAEPHGELPEFPYPLVAVPGRSAVDEWRRLRESWHGEGASPVLLGDRKQVEAALQTFASSTDSTESILRAAQELPAQALFDQRKREDDEMYGDAPPEELELFRGEWPDSPPPPHELSARLKRNPAALVYVARIPTTRSYEIPAYLKYGGWNECPSPAEHVAVHRHWHEKHGAEIYAVAGDILECWVARPPGDREAAEKLAYEQFLYCRDIVDQGTQTLLALAATLDGSSAWYFWWD